MRRYPEGMEAAKKAAILLSKKLKYLNVKPFRGVGIMRTNGSPGYELCVYLTEKNNSKTIPADFQGYRVRRAIRKSIKFAHA